MDPWSCMRAALRAEEDMGGACAGENVNPNAALIMTRGQGDQAVAHPAHARGRASGGRCSRVCALATIPFFEHDICGPCIA